MASKNKYIGDVSLEKMLEHYECKAPLHLIKMRFIGGICSFSEELKPADIIASFWEIGKEPRLETKSEADLFFKFFMGLWFKQFDKVKKNEVKLKSFLRLESAESISLCLQTRLEEIEYGFIEGFWGGKNDVKMPSFVAELIDSLSDISKFYGKLLKNIKDDISDEDKEAIIKSISQADAMFNKAVNNLIEHVVIPRMSVIVEKSN